MGRVVKEEKQAESTACSFFSASGWVLYTEGRLGGDTDWCWMESSQQCSAETKYAILVRSPTQCDASDIHKEVSLPLINPN